MKKLLFLAVFSLISAITFAQTITGVIVDADTEEGIIGATVLLKGTTTGTITDVDGSFSLNASGVQNPVLVISYLGYEPTEIEMSDRSSMDLGQISLTAEGVGLEEVVVLGLVDVADDRRTPVAVSTITAREIQVKTGNTEFPDVWKNTPSVTVNNQIGGFGDAQVFTRGFDQTNTAYLLNGQPINGMEDGKMYWSNWSGMNDIANAVQIQRGLGSSKLAISSVGGTVNIITKATEKQKGGWAGVTYGNDNYLKGTIAYNTGKMENGLGISLLATHWQGDGWANGTKGQGQNYFLSVGYQPNADHTFNFLITGAPQWHDQNFQKRISDYEDADGNIDRKYNNNWGTLDGEYLTERRNYYHKPVANLNWAWNLSDKSSLSTVLYGSWGRGGGTGSVGSRKRTEDGHVDFDAIKAANLDNGGQSTYAIRASVNSHQWYGIVTNFETKLTDNITFNLGADGRRYTGLHFRQIIDLLGADYFLDTRHTRYPNNQINATYKASPWAAISNFAAEDERYAWDYNETIQYIGGFTQLEYVKNAFSAYVQGSVSTQSHVRVDRYQYSEAEEKSDVVTNPGFNVKGGVNYNFNANNGLYVNAGLYSRQPFHDNLFLNFRNDVNPVAENEEIRGLEAGYRFRSQKFKLNLNAYNTAWNNRVETSTVYAGDTITIDGKEFAIPEDGEDWFLNTSNINQLHRGIELDMRYRPSRKITVKAYTSIGDWKFNGVSQSELFDENKDFKGSEDKLDLTGIKVGSAAQTQVGIGVGLDITRSLDAYLDFNYYDRFYGNSSAFSTDEAIELPSYGLLDLGLGYKFFLGNGQVFALRANLYNVLDNEYISYSRNNRAPDSDSANNYEKNGVEVNKSNSIAWGLGRTWNLSARYYFGG